MSLKRVFVLACATIVCGVIVFVSTPSTWSLLNMLYGAEPGVTYLPDGSSQATTIGPKSPWPEWALRPVGARVTVRSSGLTSTGLASGHAEFKTEEDAAAFQRAYARQLEAAGWTARLYALSVTPPEIAPRRSHICIVEGAKDALALRVSVDEWTRRPTNGAIFWRSAPFMPVVGAVDGAC